MNISCPNCSAVFPRPTDGGQAECPLCLHTFEPSGQTTAAAAALDLPSADDDEFESFGAPVSGSTVTLGSNAESAEASSGDDLFASASDDVDFSALLGDVGQGDDDPFASPSLEDDDLFAAPDPFSSEPSTALDSSFDDVDDDALFVSSPNSSGAAFDDDDEDDFEQGVGAAQLARDAMDAEIADRRRQGDDKRPKRAMGAAVNRLLIVVLLLLIAGIGFDFAGIDVVDKAYELAGMARPKSRKRAAKQVRPIPQNLKDPTQILDTAKTYQLEVERLKKVLAVRPDDPAIQDKLANANLDLLERYPLAFLADNAYDRELKELLAKRPQRRFPLVNRLANRELLNIQEDIDKLEKVSDHSADELGVLAWASWDIHLAAARQDALDHPGRYSDASVDPLRVAAPKSKKLNSAYETAKRALDKAQGANNRIKLLMIHARLADVTGKHDDNIKALSDFVPSAPGSLEAQELLINAYIRGNHLSKAEKEIKRLQTYAVESNDSVAARLALDLKAWLAQKRGQVEQQVTAMQGMLKIEPEDELTTVRLARMLLKDKRAQDCQRLLVDAKKRGMKSVAFEVALVELWLWANRNDDALAEIKEATKEHPKSIDLLYLRGQVEEQQKHTTTAADFYGQVIAQQPDHLRAALRLSELKSRLKRHEVAYQILSKARSTLGDKPSLLEPLAEELTALKRMKEARKVYGILLKQMPNHRGYLLNAARMDLDAGKTDRALKYLKILRDDGALNQEAAIQMAKALASKGKPSEAAETLVPFADRNPTDIRLNTLTGQYMLDCGKIDRADTLLKRAFQVAHRQGGNAETQFQYGRLAFMQKDVRNGTMRMQEAIKSEPTAHRYRYQLALDLLHPDVVDQKGSGVLAEASLQYIISYAPRYAAANNEVTYLADVYRKLATYYFNTQRASRAIPLLRKSLGLEPKDVGTRVLLGNALYQVNSSDAEPVLREVLKLRPNNHEAALYLGLTLLNNKRSSEALKWFQKASAGKSKTVVEAWYHLALIYRERRQMGPYKRALSAFVKRCPKEHPLREDAIGQLNNLR